MDNNALYNDLTEAFIVYQYRLDNPMPAPNETMEVMILKYRSDPIFNAKVKSMVSGVMHIVSKHERKETSHD
jgi:hypothetical protein